MQIGIISDIHENFHNLILALQKMEELEVERILCLGDLMNAGIAKILAHHSIPTYMIWGNNDGEKVDIVKAAYRENSQLTVSLNTYDFLTIGERKIFISHYDDLAQPMAESGRYLATFAIYDTTQHSVSIVELENSISLKSDFVDRWFRENMDRLGFRSQDSFNNL